MRLLVVVVSVLASIPVLVWFFIHYPQPWASVAAAGGAVGLALGVVSVLWNQRIRFLTLAGAKLLGRGNFRIESWSVEAFGFRTWFRTHILVGTVDGIELRMFNEPSSKCAPTRSFRVDRGTCIIAISAATPCWFTISREKFGHRISKTVGLDKEVQIDEEGLNSAFFFRVDDRAWGKNFFSAPEMKEALRTLDGLRCFWTLFTVSTAAAKAYVNTAPAIFFALTDRLDHLDRREFDAATKALCLLSRALETMNNDRITIGPN